MTKPSIRVGIGGWTFEPWRGTFYPEGLPQKRELEYAGERLTSIEINGTYYGAQKPESFRKWYAETPADFVFSVKGPRFATMRGVLAQGRESVERFFTTGVMELKEKLGPINWQLLPTRKFDAEDLGAFLELLPKELEGRRVRHVLEVRHDSFLVPELVALLRLHGVATVYTDSKDFPAIPDPTADFVYARLQDASESHKDGYAPKALDAWAERARLWAGGGVPADLKPIGEPEAHPPKSRPVFVYFINGFKPKAPAAAMALIERLR